MAKSWFVVWMSAVLFIVMAGCGSGGVTGTTLMLTVAARPVGGSDTDWRYLCTTDESNWSAGSLQATPCTAEAPQGQELSLKPYLFFGTGDEPVGGGAWGDRELAQLARDFAGMNVTELDLNNTTVTDAGLTHLAGFTNLIALYIGNCPGVTDAGVAALQEKLPDCTIYR